MWVSVEKVEEVNITSTHVKPVVCRSKPLLSVCYDAEMKTTLK